MTAKEKIQASAAKKDLEAVRTLKERKALKNRVTFLPKTGWRVGEYILTRYDRLLEDKLRRTGQLLKVSAGPFSLLGVVACVSLKDKLERTTKEIDRLEGRYGLGVKS